MDEAPKCDGRHRLEAQVLQLRIQLDALLGGLTNMLVWARDKELNRDGRELCASLADLLTEADRRLEGK